MAIAAMGTATPTAMATVWEEELVLETGLLVGVFVGVVLAAASLGLLWAVPVGVLVGFLVDDVVVVVGEAFAPRVMLKYVEVNQFEESELNTMR